MLKQKSVSITFLYPFIFFLYLFRMQPHHQNCFITSIRISTLYNNKKPTETMKHFSLKFPLCPLIPMRHQEKLYINGCMWKKFLLLLVILEIYLKVISTRDINVHETDEKMKEYRNKQTHSVTPMEVSMKWRTLNTVNFYISASIHEVS